MRQHLHVWAVKKFVQERITNPILIIRYTSHLNNTYIIHNNLEYFSYIVVCLLLSTTLLSSHCQKT